MIACICKVCCLLNFAHDRGSSTEGWIYLDCTHCTYNSVFFARCIINLSHWYKVNKVLNTEYEKHVQLRSRYDFAGLHKLIYIISQSSQLQ